MLYSTKLYTAQLIENRKSYPTSHLIPGELHWDGISENKMTFQLNRLLQVQSFRDIIGIGRQDLQSIKMSL